MSMAKAGQAYCVPGNHDVKLIKALKGRDVQITHGLAESLEQLNRETPEFRREVAKFLNDFVSHYVFDNGKQSMQGRGWAKVREFAIRRNHWGNG
jgi:protein phosphatase